MMADGGLAEAEDGAQFRHGECVPGQQPEDRQSAGVRAGPQDRHQALVGGRGGG
jgi:hypothetical protein